LSTVVQLRAPAAFRGRIIGVYLVALGVVYPIGSLIQGPLADRIGLAVTTGAAGALLAVALVAIRVVRPGLLAALSEPTVAESG
jgi:predicted MFS family arabinose efflux permease